LSDGGISLLIGGQTGPEGTNWSWRHEPWRRLRLWF